MSEQEMDEFDRKARKFLETGNIERLENILREFALCEAYENGIELENPKRVLTRAGVEVQNLSDFTEYRVAKNMIIEQVNLEKRKKKGFKIFENLKGQVPKRRSGFLDFLE